MAQLGEAIAYFQHLEDTISDCIASLAARDRKVGRIVSSELSFRAKISVFVALFLHRTGLSELPEDMREFIGRLYEAEQRRNTIVHSSWDANLQKPSAIVRRKRACRRNGLLEVREHVEPLVLEEDKETFEGLGKDLWYYMTEYAPKYAARFPKT
jgi:hypothetical protein